MELQPHPPLFSHPHPQFVAAKSLMFKSSKILITMYDMKAACMCFPMIEKNFVKYTIV